MQKKIYEQTMEVIFTGELCVDKDLNLDTKKLLEKHLKEQVEILKSATECMKADCVSADFVSADSSDLSVLRNFRDLLKATFTVRYVADVNTDEPLTKSHAFGLFDRVVTKTYFQEIEIGKIDITLNRTIDSPDNVRDFENEMEL